MTDLEVLLLKLRIATEELSEVLADDEVEVEPDPTTTSEGIGVADVVGAENTEDKC